MNICRVSPPIRSGDCRLRVVYESVVDGGRRRHAVWLRAGLSPRALLVEDAGGVRALDMEGRHLPPGELERWLGELHW